LLLKNYHLNIKLSCDYNEVLESHMLITTVAYIHSVIDCHPLLF